MSAPRVRPARAADGPALVPLFAAWSHAQPVEVVTERLAAWEDTPYARVLVAELELAVAGMAAVCATPHFARPGRFGRLIGLSVGRHARRRGVATALVRAAEALAREWGCDRLEATSTRSRDAAPGFYAALGYRDHCERQARYVREL